MIEYIDMYRDRFGVEPICRVLGSTAGGFITARGYRAAKARLPASRTIRDQVLVEQLIQIHKDNYSVYGVRKMHAAMGRAGWLIGRDQVARLMRIGGLRGVTRSRRTFTTRTDLKLVQPADLVNRRFKAQAPNQIWVGDITYVPTWAGFAYVGFIIDVFSRRIVGWSVSSSLRTEASTLVALEMAVWQARTDLTGLICHSDHGSNYLSIKYTNRVIELGAKSSTGSVGDAYDNALAETVNGLYKTELIRRAGPWRTIEQVELATLEWVWWFNNTRLHQHLGYRTPTETEQDYNEQQVSNWAATATHEKQ